MAGERTEQASPRRRQKAREEGDRPRSRELVSACATLAGTAALGWAAPGWLAGWRSGLEASLRLAASPAWRGREGVAAVLDLRAVAVAAMLPVLAVLAACAAAALVSGVVQGGGVGFHTAMLAPRWSRIDPLSNLKNLVSLRAASRLAKTLLPVAVLAALAGQMLMRQAAIPVFSAARLPGALTDAYRLLADAAWILFVWSAIDYAVEWRSWNERLKMSRQELRDEYKESEGNPQIRGRIRNLQRQMRTRMLRADVARATVVITNPTHYAVALSFDFDTMDAPRVLAKGRNLVAEQIKHEARWAGVPIVENPPLARSLYRTVEPGQAIPYELYAAVAGILAYLYRQRVEERVRRQAATVRAAAAARPKGSERQAGAEPSRASSQATSPAGNPSASGYVSDATPGPAPVPGPDAGPPPGPAPEPSSGGSSAPNSKENV
jgi:flagellar biosynthetic protein FlhB